MSPSRPFVDGKTGTLDREQILTEAVPLGKLIGVFVAVALVPLALAFLLGGRGAVAGVLAVLAQFVLAVGAGIVLMYAVARGIDLSDGDLPASDPGGDRPGDRTDDPEVPNSPPDSGVGDSPDGTEVGGSGGPDGPDGEGAPAAGPPDGERSDG